MASNQVVLTLDIGSSAIRLAEFEKNGSSFKMLKYASEDFSQEINDDNRYEQILECLKRLLLNIKPSSKKAYVSISSQLAFVRFVSLPPIKGDEDRVNEIVEYEARQNIPFDMDEVVWDYQLIGSDVSEMEVMLTVVKNDVLDPITKAIYDVGIYPDYVDLSPTACYNAAKANAIGMDECVMILSIGASCSNLIFIDNDKFFYRNVSVAGHSITQQIMKEFGVSFEEAEELKKRHGFVALGGAYEDPDSEVASTISKIVRNIMARLHTEINRSINVFRSQQKGNKPVKLFLAGGSSVFPYADTFFKNKLRMDVEYLNVFNFVQVGNDVDKNLFLDQAHLCSELIGLSLRVFNQCPVEISLVSNSIRTRKFLSEKKRYIYISCILLCVAFFLVYRGDSLRLEKEQNSIKNGAPIIEKRYKLLKDIKERQQKIAMLKSEELYLNGVLYEKTKLYNMFSSLNSAVDKDRNNILIISVEPEKRNVSKSRKPMYTEGIKMVSYEIKNKNDLERAFFKKLKGISLFDKVEIEKYDLKDRDDKMNLYEFFTFFTFKKEEK